MISTSVWGRVWGAFDDPDWCLRQTVYASRIDPDCQLLKPYLFAGQKVGPHSRFHRETIDSWQKNQPSMD